MLISLYLLLFLFGFLFPLLILLFALFALVSDFKGAPYVPITQQFISQILKKAQLKKGQVFMELGSGDGRVIIEAVAKYQVQGIGIEIHPLLIIYSRLWWYRGFYQAQTPIRQNSRTAVGCARG